MKDFYYRKDILKEIIKYSKDREVSVKYNDDFGKRPDIIQFEGDVKDLVIRGASSFHISEERWKDPLNLRSGMSKRELDSLRKGWDLVIDIDCKYWDYSKYISYLVVKALKKYGIKSMGVKFSGNKGWHICVPFEAFPKKVHGKDIINLFPEGARRITRFIIDYIDSEETDYELSNYILKSSDLDDLAKGLNKSKDGLFKEKCVKCGKEKSKKESSEFICKYCGKHKKSNKKFLYCEDCNKLMEKINEEGRCDCGSNKFIKKFDSSSILNIDEILVSSRHLFRMPYSYHEKSGLISIPIKPSRILDFDKKEAKPENVKVEEEFFKDVEEEEASRLIVQAFDWNFVDEDEKPQKRSYDIPKVPVKEENFAPCIKECLNGIEKDGRKRAVFILINYLRCNGWKLEDIQKLLSEWNKKNYEPLREGYLLSQVNWYKKQRENISPPNCDNEAYYKDLGICVEGCRRRNPKNPLRFRKN